MHGPLMQMPGGWTMSMTWMRMPGQTWLAAAASFVGMWTVMMVAMMLPALAPALCRYRKAEVAVAYFLVWTAVGIVVYPLGAGLAAVEMQYPAAACAVPAAVGILVVLAGALQFTAWKAHHLACCRELRLDAASPWKLGLRLGLHCNCGCAGFTAVLLALGVMDLRVMAVVTVAITAERVAPNGERIARATGALAVIAGFYLIAQASGLA